MLNALSDPKQATMETGELLPSQEKESKVGPIIQAGMLETLTNHLKGVDPENVKDFGGKAIQEILLVLLGAGDLSKVPFLKPFTDKLPKIGDEGLNDLLHTVELIGGRILNIDAIKNLDIWKDVPTWVLAVSVIGNAILPEGAIKGIVSSWPETWQAAHNAGDMGGDIMSIFSGFMKGREAQAPAINQAASVFIPGMSPVSQPSGAKIPATL